MNTNPGHTSMRTRRSWVTGVFLVVAGFLLAGAGAALAFFVISVIDPSGNDALAQATSLSAPTSPIASDAGATAVNLSWTNPGTQVPTASYEVTASPGGAFCMTSTNSCQVTGLSPGTAYTLSVNAFLDTWTSSAASTTFTTLGVTTAALANGTYGGSYSTSLAAKGGGGTYTHWALSSGTLPSWATLNTSTGVITGTPNAVGTGSALVFTVTDSSGYTASSGPLSLTVNKDSTTATVSETASSATYGAENGVTFTATVTGASGNPTGTVVLSDNGTPVTCGLGPR